VAMMNVSVDEQMSYVMDYLRLYGQTTLLHLVGRMTEKVRVIVTIIALLELTKNSIVSLTPVPGMDDVSIRPLTPVVPLRAAYP